MRVGRILAVKQKWKTDCHTIKITNRTDLIHLFNMEEQIYIFAQKVKKQNEQNKEKKKFYVFYVM